jgi:HTH-type transcriptional regulator / antitoxin HipB
MDQPTRTQSQLGAFIRRARKNAGLTQGELGERINRRQATISNLESPEGGATLDTLFAVLAALELELVVRPRTKVDPSDIADLV